MVNSKVPRAVLVHDPQFPVDAVIADVEWELATIPLPKGSELPDLPGDGIDLFVLLVDARTGISSSMIAVWSYFQDRQFPRILLVQGIGESAVDFDDIVLIGNRTLELLATPFLVLHDDLGRPNGLIELETGKVFDYSTERPVETIAEPELLDLVTDFGDEYESNFADLGSEGFAAGIYAIALPIGAANGLGVPELNRILQAIPKQ